jgi:hypothetical protein
MRLKAGAGGFTCLQTAVLLQVLEILVYYLTQAFESTSSVFEFYFSMDHLAMAKTALSLPLSHETPQWSARPSSLFVVATTRQTGQAHFEPTRSLHFFI